MADDIRAALEFYANPKNWERKADYHPYTGTVYRASLAMQDEGRTARKALAATPPAGERDEWRQLLVDARNGLRWALAKERFWECDCEPVYEYDTNATTHQDSCAVLLEGHFEATADWIRMALDADARPANDPEEAVRRALDGGAWVVTEFNDPALPAPDEPAGEGITFEQRVRASLGSCSGPAYQDGPGALEQTIETLKYLHGVGEGGALCPLCDRRVCQVCVMHSPCPTARVLTTLAPAPTPAPEPPGVTLPDYGCTCDYCERHARKGEPEPPGGVDVWAGKVLVDPSREFCHRCARNVEQVWHAADDLWQAIGLPENDVLCMACFEDAAEEEGISVQWWATPLSEGAR